MSALSPTTGTIDNTVIGSQRQVCAQFASVADGDTYATGLTLIKMVDVTSGSATPKTMGATFSGGTVTFHVVSGPDTTTCMCAKGY